jgi:hypothetical protein
MATLVAERLMRKVSDESSCSLACSGNVAEKLLPAEKLIVSLRDEPNKKAPTQLQNTSPKKAEQRCQLAPDTASGTLLRLRRLLRLLGLLRL